jgi:hypothetical protein
MSRRDDLVMVLGMAILAVLLVLLAVIGTRL